MTTYRMYRSATHPEFVAEVIEPELAKYGYPAALAPLIAQMIDESGWPVEVAVDVLQGCVKAFADDGASRDLPTLPPLVTAPRASTAHTDLLPKPVTAAEFVRTAPYRAHGEGWRRP